MNHWRTMNAEEIREVESCVLHFNESVRDILGRRDQFHRFVREHELIEEGDAVCFCCNYREIPNVMWIINEDAIAMMLYEFARVLNTGNFYGFGRQIDLFFRIGELATVIDYESGPLHYAWYPDRNVRMCNFCYGALKVKIEVFVNQFKLGDRLMDDLVKEPEC